MTLHLRNLGPSFVHYDGDACADPAPTDDRAVAALGGALGLNGIAVENVGSIGNAEQWLPDLSLAEGILAAILADPEKVAALLAVLLDVDTVANALPMPTYHRLLTDEQTYLRTSAAAFIRRLTTTEEPT